MTILSAAEFISEQKFTFAESYARTFPHYYLQRAKCTNEKHYEQFIELIRDIGLVYHFFHKQYIYLEIDGFIYWEVGRPIKCVQVLNKVSSNSLIANKQRRASDEIANELKSKLKARELYLDALLNKEKRTNQDERQIRFLMDTQRKIHGGGKNIIDNHKQEVRYE